MKFIQFTKIEICSIYIYFTIVNITFSFHSIKFHVSAVLKKASDQFTVPSSRSNTEEKIIMFHFLATGRYHHTLVSKQCCAVEVRYYSYCQGTEK